jgi:hypothetical protein
MKFHIIASGSASTHGEIRDCSLVADEAQVEQTPQNGRDSPLPDRQALAHDAVAVRDEHEGDEGGRLEEDPRHVRAKGHPQGARLKVHARVPEEHCSTISTQKIVTISFHKRI